MGFIGRVPGQALGVQSATTLAGMTATVPELNYVSGVTSGIQGQLGVKAPLASPTFTGNVSITGLLQVTSNTLVTNLNADFLDGQHGTYYTANSIFAAHTSNVANPHATTALQVGLGNVTNESKATLFTSPTFTGIPLLSQSPNTGDYNNKIPTTSFVNLATRQELKKTNQGYGCVWNQVADTYVTRGTTYQSYGYSWNQSTDVYTTILTN